MKAIVFQSDWNIVQNCWEYHTVEIDTSTETPVLETIQLHDLDFEDLDQNSDEQKYQMRQTKLKRINNFLLIVVI